jgi:tRNA (guanine-N7-)-methyltransferase
MSVEFIEECMRVLKKDGTLELRTDSPNYFEYSTSLLDSFKEYTHEILTNKDIDVTSKYEARWKRQEKTIWDVKIKAKEESPEVVLEGDFSFPDVYNKEDLKNKIITKAIIKEDYLVHFESIYEIEDKEISGLLLKVTFGSFNRPVSKYLFLENGKMRYFQGNPIITRTNLAAHRTILETLG